MGVGEHDATAGDRRENARDARTRLGGELDRVGLGVIDAAIDDVDRIEAAERSQPQASLTNDDIGTLHEREPEDPGELRILHVTRRAPRHR